MSYEKRVGGRHMHQACPVPYLNGSLDERRFRVDFGSGLGETFSEIV